MRAPDVDTCFLYSLLYGVSYETRVARTLHGELLSYLKSKFAIWDYWL